MMLFPFCGCFGIVLLLVGLGSAAMCLASRYALDRSDEVYKPLPARWLRRIFLITFWVSLAYAGFSLFFLESFPSHAWRNRTRSTAVAAVDAETGRPLLIDVRDEGIDAMEDPFVVLEETRNSPGEMQIQSNFDHTLMVMSDGYESKTVRLTDASPPGLVIPLTRTVPSTATKSK